ncbi:MAG: hypothetical protein E7200_06735 [Selenomonas ruminantium]|nr:hypothetical protein [Selenomonas ruminantium]
MSESVKKIGNMKVRVISSNELSLKNKIISSRDVEMDRRATAAVQSAIDKAKICQKPIAKYDVETKRAFVEYADGSIKYVD